MIRTSTLAMPSQGTLARREGVFARMLRLWLEHHQRMIDLGIRPL